MAEEKKVGKSRRRTVVGRVISSKMDKTIVVEAENLTRHPMYGKFYRQYKKFKAHDETNQCEVGDKVLIIESRPLSKQKRFRLNNIVEKVKKVS